MNPKALALLACTLAAFGCRSRTSTTSVEPLEPGPAVIAKGVVAGEHGEPVGLEHYRRLSPKLAQGGEPVGEQAYANLAALGIHTVISVDGAAPDAELARKHGLAYVHVPIGYDGIQARQALEIVKAVEVAEGPVYFHCHHGLHRGPAAAAIARIAADGIGTEQALRELRESGCKYEGLFAAVQDFRAPSAEELAAIPADLPSVRVPKGRVQVMSAIDRHWDAVNAAQKARWAASAEHPDVDPAHEVGMIENTLRSWLAQEEHRSIPDAHFLELLRASHGSTVELEAAIRAGDAAAADQAHTRLKRSCDACHAEYRN